MEIRAWPLLDQAMYSMRNIEAVDPSVAFRWMQLGLPNGDGHRVRLEAVRVGKSWRTSEAALRKACVRVAGQSPTQLIHSRMLIEAERQLRYTGMSITQIAYYLGFEDPAYFSRFFAKGMGASPRSFRRGTGTS